MIKQLIFTVFFLSIFTKIQAQTPLHEYTGQYILKDDAPFKTYTISLQAEALMGEADSFGANKLLKQEAPDTFLSTSQYGSTIIFIRNSEQKIVGLKILIQGMELEAIRKL